ncbi:uncharacterized protein DNG_00238 [Cephalotrichum gorgonifer]|uniref:Yeast cell wall synthesis Kre9/Knh1-like N-terminal domain-containing protein n=1 Tax=Cephalotrichum gorgonifer TaxID=2041049 RepID=A0AAE8MPM0_9PEZI|nr:uncharacterized protein DNG_00238 [Cephalotrichum gorgonifer]
MKSYATLVALALAATANAAKFTNVAVNPEPGKPFELTWSDAQGPVTINLKNGPSGNLKTVETLASGVTGDSTTITLNAEDLPSDTYAFEIVDSSGPNYSLQFDFEGTGTAPSVTGTTTPSSTESPSSTVTTAKSTSSSSETASGTTSETASSTSSERPSRTSDADQSEETVPEDNGSSNLSPLALIFVTAAAMMYFN